MTAEGNEVRSTPAMEGSLERSTMFIAIREEPNEYRKELQEYLINGPEVRERWAFQLAEDTLQVTEGELFQKDFIYKGYLETVN